MTSKCQQLVATGLEIRSKTLAAYSSTSQIDLDSYVNAIQTLKMAVSSNSEKPIIILSLL